jgi:hypothetical protein
VANTTATLSNKLELEYMRYGESLKEGLVGSFDYAFQPWRKLVLHNSVCYIFGFIYNNIASRSNYL